LGHQPLNNALNWQMLIMIQECSSARATHLLYIQASSKEEQNPSGHKDDEGSQGRRAETSMASPLPPGKSAGKQAEVHLAVTFPKVAQGSRVLNRGVPKKLDGMDCLVE
jgi:hypothetical protein